MKSYRRSMPINNLVLELCFVVQLRGFPSPVLVMLFVLIPRKGNNIPDGKIAPMREQNCNKSFRAETARGQSIQ